jgi:hypothetical protein
MIRTRQLFFLILLLLLGGSTSRVIGQNRQYEGPDDPAGDPAAEREAFMDGNRFIIKLRSSGVTGHWGFLDGTKWPANSPEGLAMYDDCRILIGGKVFVTNDSIPVTDPAALAVRSGLDSLYLVEAPTHEHSETSPDGTATWTLTPVFGYFNVLSESPAVSIDANTWPPAGWPSRGDEVKWPGEWNGRFGRGIQYAQMESYVVANDAQDQEYVQPGQPLKYYPRRVFDAGGSILREVRIGDKHPEYSTTSQGQPWGGLGIRIEMRGYQWDNPQTRDAVFWEYTIANISEYDLPQAVFGYYMDMGIGHYLMLSDGEDDVGYFNKSLNLSYCWDTNGVGDFDYAVGALGFAFLESPGIPDDLTDNDEDGLTDEKRDNKAAALVGPADGITNMPKFLAAFGFESVNDLQAHWDADEDQDWQDGQDLDGNGRYDSGEFAGDDVGLDGVSPADLNYFGPDADGTECNHRPDLLEGAGCEPNFGLLDVSESDMLGLQTFHLFPHPQKNPPQVMHDKECFKMIADKVLQDEPYKNPSNLYQAFGTGPFRLDKGRTERISMATIAAFENLETLNDLYQAPIIFERKKVVQTIYESDYRFARPPEMPTLHAVAGNGMVTLTWDNRADKLTREPLDGGKNDFEGYKLYKATDRSFDDALILRDGFGNPAGLSPIKQWDLVNEYQGHTNYALVEGEGFYLGSNSGIQHFYVDKNVENGRTYYYFLAAYDHGLKEKDIAPSENVPTIKVDENELITFQSPNVQVVIPCTPAAGYVEPSVELLHDPDQIAGPAQTLSIKIADPKQVKENHLYRMTFDVNVLKKINKITDDGLTGKQFIDEGFQIRDLTDSSLAYFENPANYIKNHIAQYDTGLSYGVNLSYNLLRTGQLIETDLFDGIQVAFELPLGANGLAYFDSTRSGWVTGNGRITIRKFAANMAYFPFETDIIFTGPDELYTSRLTRATGITYNTDVTVAANQYLLGQALPFYAVDRKHQNAQGEPVKCDLVAVDMNDNQTFDLNADEIYLGHTNNNQRGWVMSLCSFNFVGVDEGEMPKPGDVYRLTFNTPFSMEDTLLFRIPAMNFSATPVDEENLSHITVVPNPYVVTNTLEPAVRNNNLNQRRRIMFTNLPARCTIKIFTMSGYLVDEIQVDNTVERGIAYWDVLTKEDLEVAAGVYLYHIKSEYSGKEKLGKFAIIK